MKYVPESAGDLGSEIEASIKIIMKPGGEAHVIVNEFFGDSLLAIISKIFKYS